MSIFRSDIQLEQYDSVEVHPVDHEGNHCGPDDPDLRGWSVFLHYRTGGLRCLADCETYGDAHAVASALECTWPQHLTADHGSMFLEEEAA